MQETEPTHVETQPEVVVPPEVQTEMQCVKPDDGPSHPIEQATPNQVSPAEIQPVGGETTGGQGEEHMSRSRD
jgi:hypothetical protein